MAVLRSGAAAVVPPKISLTQADLLTAMKGRDGLKGWDVLVAYDEKAINDILKERMKEIPNVLEGKVEFDDEEDDGLDITHWHYILNLLPPSMEFNSTDYTIKLTFCVTGSYVKNGGRGALIPDGIRLQLTTKLSYVRGEVIDNESSAQAWTGHIATPGDAVVISFNNPKDERNYENHHVALDFTNVQAAFVVDASVPTSPAREEMEKRTRFLNSSSKTRIENQFRTAAGVKFYLVGLSNKQVRNETGTARVLTPKSFAVTLIGQAGEPGALCMWIQCNDRTGGTPDDGNTPLKFMPDPALSQISPIPAGASAAVIISHNCMWDVFVKPALSAANLISPTVSSVLGTAGMKFSGILPGETIRVPEYSNPIGRHKEDSAEVSFNLSEYPLQFTLNPEFTGTNLTYTFEKSITDHKIHIADVTISGSSAETFVQDIYITIKFAASGSGSWKVTPSAAGAPNQIELPLPNQTGMQITLTNEGRALFDLTHYSADLRNNVTNVTVPTVKVEFGHLDYFLTTNLLFPGERVFYAKEGGIATPRDTMIVGNIKRLDGPSESFLAAHSEVLEAIRGG